MIPSRLREDIMRPARFPVCRSSSADHGARREGKLKHHGLLLRIFAALAVCTLGGAASAKEMHLVFPVPSHPDYPQAVVHKVFELDQSEARAFRYGCEARCAGLDPETPPSHSNLGMTYHVVYTDGTGKWGEPKARLSPAKGGWQKLSEMFEPPRPVKKVVLYVRLARPGEAWYRNVFLEEEKTAAAHGPCSLKERKGIFELENDFIRLVVDPARGGSAVELAVKSDGVPRATRAKPLFTDVLEGGGDNGGRTYRVVRRRNTADSAELTLALTGPAGHQFLEIEKTYRLSRRRDGVEVIRRYRNLPAAMSDVDICPVSDGRSERISVPLGKAVERRRVFFSSRPDGAGAAETSGASRRFSLELSEELVTAHTPWLKPYAGGGTRALFLLDLRQQREIVELAQRMDLDFRTVRISCVPEIMGWGMIERYGTYNFQDANAALREELSGKPFDVIVIAGRIWERIDEANRRTIQNALAKGTGLVSVRNRALAAEGRAPCDAARKYILRSVPSALLPFGASKVETFESSGGARAVLLDYDARDGLTPFVPFAVREPSFFYADYTLGMVAKSLVWAARKDLPVPPDAKIEVSEEKTPDGLVIRRTIRRNGGGAVDFGCEIAAGDVARAFRPQPAYPAREIEWPDFPVAMGESCHHCGNVKRYLLPLRYRQLKSVGVNQIRFWKVDSPETYRPYLPYGFGMQFPVAWGQLEGDRFSREFSEPYAKTGDRKYLCRKPCFSDADYLSSNRAKVAEKVKALKVLKPQVYDCNDENSLTRWEAPFDFCFSDHCLAAFRVWLKGRYADLAALNAEWETDFADWEKVVPDTAAEARARAKRTGRRCYAAWADHRRFMEITYMNFFAGVKEEVDRHDPGRRFDMGGTQPPNGWTGMDYWLLSKIVDLPAIYDLQNVGEIVRSFRTFAHPWCGYGAKGRSMKYYVWRNAFRFLDFGISYYHEGLMLMPDYTIPETLREAGEAWKDLQDGGARLLRSLTEDPAALIHYSHASVHAAQIEDRYADFVAARERWINRLVATGTPFRFVAYAEIENGELERTTAKTLVLPASSALSDREVAALKAFAAKGGQIVGDRFSGLMDGHCRMRERNPIAGIVSRKDGFGEAKEDGVRSFSWRSKIGAAGRYFGFVRNLDDARSPAVRRTALPEAAFVYDLRRGRCLGRVRAFETSLMPGDASFFAALPYEVKALKAERDGSLRMETSSGPSAYHPVKVEFLDDAGRVVDSDMTEVRGSVGKWRNKAPKAALVVFTDFISKKRCVLK